VEEPKFTHTMLPNAALNNCTVI